MKRKGKSGAVCRCFFFSSTVLCCWRFVEVVCYYIPILYILIQQFNRISKPFQQFFRNGIVPAHASSSLVTVIAAVLVGSIGKTIGCRCQLPALLHYFPHLRLLHLDLRADEQRDDVIEAKRNRPGTHTCHDVKQQFYHFYLQPIMVASDYLPQGIRLQQLRVEPHAAFLFGGQLSRYLFNKSFILMH